MPKTRDAFALRDFDRARILQRPYFKKYLDFDSDFIFKRFVIVDEDSTDEKILSALSAQIGDSITELERKNETLSKIHDRLHKYMGKLLKHCGRLRRYRWSKDKQSAEFIGARELDVKYSVDILPAIGNFSTAVMIALNNLASALCHKERVSFSERLKEARLKKGLSRRDLADELGYTESGFGRIESGRNEPKLAVLRQLSRRLNVSTDWLLGLK